MCIFMPIPKSLPLQWSPSHLNLPSEHCRPEVYTATQNGSRIGNCISGGYNATVQALRHDLRKWEACYCRKPHNKALWGYACFNATEKAILRSWSVCNENLLACYCSWILDRVEDYKGLVNRKIKRRISAI